MMNNFLLPGLQDLCVSRTSFKWGIPVDFDPKHVVYVWLDALSNYITGLGYDADGNHDDLYKKYWPADLHLIGKDIIRFHTIYWPIFLMALGEPLPKQIFGHPWLLQGGEKMSKSKGNVIYVDDLIGVFGVDAIRYFVIHETPYENDGVITWELIVERYNSDLANTLGNLVNRTVSMSNKYLGGTVADKGVSDPAIDDDLKKVVTGAYDRVEEKMDTLHAADALTEIFAIFKRCNKYIDETEPWKLGKDPAQADRLSTVLHNLCEGILIGASLLAPFMPETAEKIAAQLGMKLRGFDELGSFSQAETKVTDSPEILFARLDEAEILEKAAKIQEQQRAEFLAQQETARANLVKAGRMTQEEADALRKAQLEALGGAKGADQAPAEGAAPQVEAKPAITYDDFAKCQFQIGEIVKCEEVPKSKKLLCSQVRIGNETRQILSGIKQYYSPEEMVGKKVLVLVNLAPRQMAGLTSEGMLLCAEDADGNLALMTPEKAMPSGAEVC
nr:methionine--tRNA ligase subunit beta [Lachnospiraceae bacterium]